MPPTWTSEQVLALAPDAASSKAGQGLASASSWEMSGCDERAAWGLAKGSGANPYQTAVAFDGPAFKCSCPSRKIPCKHVLALMLMLVKQAVSQGDPPEWVKEWIDKREAKAAAPPKEKSATPATPEEQAKRAEQRLGRVAKGIEECGLWLDDLVRNGLATPEVQSPAFWKRIEARMVDAQAPGLARYIRQMEALVGSPNWQEQVLEKMGLLHLLLTAYSQLDQLSEGLQADVRNAFGWTVKKDDLLLEQAVKDLWTVIGQREYEDERLRVRRYWLYGKESSRWATVIAFSTAGMPFDVTLMPDSAFEGEVCFYPGAYPLRAHIVSSREAKPVVIPSRSIEELQVEYANALAANPWTETVPWQVTGQITHANGRWELLAEDGIRVPLHFKQLGGWAALAASGGSQVAVVGEWSGKRLQPFAILGAGGYQSL